MTLPVSRITALFVEDVEESGVAKLVAYWDGYRAWTIGFGHTGPDVVRGSTCTREQADLWLQEDLQNSANNVGNVVRVPLNDNQRTVLISFDFNEGDGALDGSTLLRRLNAGDYASVPIELGRWVYAADASGKMRYSAGLANRRTREAALWQTPSATVHPAPPLTEPPIPDVPMADPIRAAYDPDQPNVPPPMSQSTTIWSTIGGVMASGGGMVLGYIQSPYALLALGMVLVFGYFVLRERFKHRSIGGV